MDNEVSIPEGYRSITPYFTVVGADRCIDFLTTAFDASLIKESRYQDNRVQHARLLVGDSIIMLNESTADYPANISQMHLYVADADRVYERALRLGATSLMAPNDRPHGDRNGRHQRPVWQCVVDRNTSRLVWVWSEARTSDDDARITA